VRVPASSANLGPGYDSFGLALGIHNSFSAEDSAEWSVSMTGEGVETLAGDESNAVVQAMHQVFAEAGETGRTASVTCANQIPLGQGLGSSAAAIVGGMLLADAMCEGRVGQDRLFEMAAEMEGHPDNVAAALLGGMTVSWPGEKPSCATVGPACGLAVVLVLSDESLSTPDSRHLLPNEVPHADAARNTAWSGALVAGMALGRADLIAQGLHDCIHEPYRTEAIPDLPRVREALTEAGALGAVLSGAGPAVIGLVCGEDDDAALAAARAIADRAADGIADIDGRLPPRAWSIERGGPEAG
jgi:homoserine kinase